MWNYIEWEDFEYSIVYTEAEHMNHQAIMIVNRYNNYVAVLKGEEDMDWDETIGDYKCWASDALIELNDLKSEHAEFMAMVEAE